MHLDGAFALFHSVRIFLQISENCHQEIGLASKHYFWVCIFHKLEQFSECVHTFSDYFSCRIQFNFVSQIFNVFTWLDADKLLHLTDTQSYLPKDQKYAKAEILQN